MDNWKNYLNDVAGQLKKSLETELDQYKNNLSKELNSFLIKEISNAEQIIKTKQEEYVAGFKREMEKLVKNREKDSKFGFLYDKEMEFIKNSFETQMRNVEKLWESYILKIKEKMK